METGINRFWNFFSCLHLAKGKKAGKPVICILMDRPVYGVQFILESKVMAAGLYTLGYIYIRLLPLLLTLGSGATLKFQTNTKMAGTPTNMYYPISRTRWQVSPATRYRLLDAPHKKT